MTETPTYDEYAEVKSKEHYPEIVNALPSGYVVDRTVSEAMVHAPAPNGKSIYETLPQLAVLVRRTDLENPSFDIAIPADDAESLTPRHIPEQVAVIAVSSTVELDVQVKPSNHNA